jgi:hypothetical protein
MMFAFLSDGAGALVSMWTELPAETLRGCAARRCENIAANGFDVGEERLVDLEQRSSVEILDEGADLLPRGVLLLELLGQAGRCLRMRIHLVLSDA